MTERRLYSVSEAATLLNLGRSALYEQIRSGRLVTVKSGRRRLVPAVSIDNYVALLLAEAGGDGHAA